MTWRAREYQVRLRKIDIGIGGKVAVNHRAWSEKLALEVTKTISIALNSDGHSPHRLSRKHDRPGTSVGVQDDVIWTRILFKHRARQLIWNSIGVRPGKGGRFSRAINGKPRPSEWSRRSITGRH